MRDINPSVVTKLTDGARFRRWIGDDIEPFLRELTELSSKEAAKPGEAPDHITT